MIDAPVGDARKGWAPAWPELPDFEIPIGKARVLREGADLTVVTYGRLAPVSAAVAERLAAEGISAEVIDLRSLAPFDEEAVVASVAKTRRCLVVNEDTEVTNFGEHVLRRVTERCFYQLEAPPRLLAGANLPGIGLAWSLERVSVPQEEHVEAAIRDLARTFA
jgi:2-oxoisovalerate dehydrogenase E1 component beta subunit